ncbi:MAG: response regulator [Planctomycetota bacterium]|jgi:CheY-like chemotaxis protein
MARILVVDDSELARSLIGDVLAKEGHTVEVASGGGEALDALASKSFDLLVTDWVMPGMMGEELITRVRDSFPALPVVVITSYYDSELLSKDKFPPEMVVKKPFKNEDLVRAVEQNL